MYDEWGIHLILTPKSMQWFRAWNKEILANPSPDSFETQTLPNAKHATVRKHKSPILHGQYTIVLLLFHLSFHSSFSGSFCEKKGPSQKRRAFEKGDESKTSAHHSSICDSCRRRIICHFAMLSYGKKWPWWPSGSGLNISTAETLLSQPYSCRLTIHCFNTESRLPAWHVR